MNASLTDQLRQGMYDCGYTQSEICRATGISYGALNRFWHCKGGLCVEAVDSLGEFLGARLRFELKKRKRRKR